MHRGWLSRLRLIRHVTVQVFTLAMLLPALLSLLPQPALSAAVLLEQDIARAICSETGPHSSAPQGHAGHERNASCILCGVCASAGAGGLSAAPGSVSPPVRGSAVRLTAQLRLQHLPAPSGGSPPRGPPSI